MNDEMKFDPLTGKPLNTVQTSNTEKREENKTEEKTTVPYEIQNNVQSIATVDQSNDKFLNNEQNSSNIKNEKLNEKSSYIFIFVIFAIILLAIIFLFPLLNKFF